MKRALIAAAVTIAIVAVAVQIAGFFHFGDKHERAGHFDIYTSSKPPTSTFLRLCIIRGTG